MKRQSSPGPMSEARLLVVDDEAEVRSGLARLLTLMGYEADEAGSGRQALGMLGQTAYDTMILDIRMPGMDGLEVMDCVLESYPHVPVILLTGHATLESAIAAVRSDAVDYLIKPASSRDLAMAVAKALEGRNRQKRRRAEFEEGLLSTGPVTLDRRRRLVYVDRGGSHHADGARLTPSETDLLAHLMLRAGVVCTCQELAREALQWDVDGPEARYIVRPHICRLRGKIEPDPASPRLVRTAEGRGYVFSG